MYKATYQHRNFIIWSKWPRPKASGVMKLTIFVEGFLVYITMYSVFLPHAQKWRRRFLKIYGPCFVFTPAPKAPLCALKFIHYVSFTQSCFYTKFEKNWPSSFQEFRNVQLLKQDWRRTRNNRNRSDE